MHPDPALPPLLASGDLRIHLIGVAGSGMSGIASLLLQLGHRVSGTDRSTTIETDRLQLAGLDFRCPHTPEPVRDAHLVIRSSAIKPGNPDLDEAARLRIPVILRAEALAALMSLRSGIIVAGMHGKTTTSALAAHLLREGGLRPSHYVGAEIPILGTNAHWDPSGPHFVAEADESDGTVLLYRPQHSIILNIEAEHLDHYRTLDAILDTFAKVRDHTAGHAFYCHDDTHASAIFSRHPRPVSFGLRPGARCHATDLHTEPFATRFTVHWNGDTLGQARLNIPGPHNVSNALAAIALALTLEIPFNSIVSALDTFQGARRRFERHHDAHGILVVDDYGHHPTEISRTLEAARDCGRRRLIVAFQPHRYTRTESLMDDFARAFTLADRLLLADIYPAGEAPIPGITSQTLADEINAVSNPLPAVTVHHSIPAIAHAAAAILQPGDLLLTLGAGNIHEAATTVAQDLATAARLREILGPGSTLRLSEPLSRHTTLKVGGPAQFWAEPADENALAALVIHCHAHHIPLLPIGRGSNLLVRDGGLPGVACHLAAEPFQTIEIHPETHTITIGAGVKLQRLAASARKALIGGFEWMEGIPGTLGGSLRMNAGAMGIDTFSQVVSLRLCTPQGQIINITPSEIEVHYRHVPLLDTHIALSATLKGHPATLEQIDALLDQSREKRRRTQPIAPSAGCIFRNPASIPAGKLVDELGLKNTRLGAARVSDIHGNFLVNDGGATATDLLALIATIRNTAATQRNITLVPEVQIIGQDE